MDKVIINNKLKSFDHEMMKFNSFYVKNQMMYEIELIMSVDFDGINRYQN